MNKETLLKICDAVFEEGCSFQEWYSQRLLVEIKNLRYEEDEEILHSEWMSSNIREDLKKSKIEKVLKQFGVDVEGERK